MSRCNINLYNFNSVLYMQNISKLKLKSVGSVFISTWKDLGSCQVILTSKTLNNSSWICKENFCPSSPRLKSQTNTGSMAYPSR